MGEDGYIEQRHISYVTRKRKDNAVKRFLVNPMMKLAGLNKNGDAKKERVSA